MELLCMLKSKILEIYKKYFERDKIDKFPVFYINRESNIATTIRSKRRRKNIARFRQ